MIRPGVDRGSDMTGDCNHQKRGSASVRERLVPIATFAAEIIRKEDEGIAENE
jgi:hypothetical protein